MYMGLSKSTLASELKKFCDPEDGSFEGYPTTIEVARQKWAAAFDKYLQDIAVTTASLTATPTEGLTLSGAQPAFVGSISLDAALDESAAAQDFADAWAAAMNAVVIAGTGTLVEGLTYTATPPLAGNFDNFDSQKSTLKTDLENLFRGPTLDAGTRCDDIALKIHDATDKAAIKSSVTFIANDSSGATQMKNIEWG
jgi:hypothetical protein